MPFTTSLFIAHMNGHQVLLFYEVYSSFGKTTLYSHLAGYTRSLVKGNIGNALPVAFLSSITKSYQVSEEHASKQKKKRPKHVRKINLLLSIMLVG